MWIAFLCHRIEELNLLKQFSVYGPPCILTGVAHIHIVARRVKFREQESQKKVEEKEKRKEELQEAEAEKERILEAIRQKVLSLSCLLHIISVDCE